MQDRRGIGSHDHNRGGRSRVVKLQAQSSQIEQTVDQRRTPEVAPGHGYCEFKQRVRDAVLRPDHFF